MNNDQTIEKSVVNNELGRRSFLQNVTAAGLSLSLAGMAGNLFGQTPQKIPNQPEADSGLDYPMPRPTAKTESDFRNGVIGPATLSLITSEIAVDKATNAETKEFANFELREAIAVTTVLKQLNTPVPPMDAAATATLEKIKASAKGKAFDKAYITAQLANHEFLRDLAEVYLKNSAGQTSMEEVHTRQLATLALSTFKEHVVHTKKI